MFVQGLEENLIDDVCRCQHNLQKKWGAAMTLRRPQPGFCTAATVSNESSGSFNQEDERYDDGMKIGRQLENGKKCVTRGKKRKKKFSECPRKAGIDVKERETRNQSTG